MNTERATCDEGLTSPFAASIALAFEAPDACRTNSNHPGAEPSDRRLHGAQRELERLHVEELSRLLAEASVLRGRPLEDQSHDARVRQLAAWRVALADELAAGNADGVRRSPALEALIDGCSPATPSAWPAASQLAHAAVALTPSAAARVALGRAWLSEGAVERAAECFAELLRGAPARRTELAVRRALLDARACG